MKEVITTERLVDADCRVGSDHRLDLFDVLRLLRIGLVVKHVDGSVCLVEGFDITKHRNEMPVTFRRLSSEMRMNGKLTDIAAVMIPCEDFS